MAIISPPSCSRPSAGPHCRIPGPRSDPSSCWSSPATSRIGGSLWVSSPSRKGVCVSRGRLSNGGTVGTCGLNVDDRLVGIVCGRGGMLTCVFSPLLKFRRDEPRLGGETLSAV